MQPLFYNANKLYVFTTLTKIRQHCSQELIFLFVELRTNCNIICDLAPKLTAIFKEAVQWQRCTYGSVISDFFPIPTSEVISASAATKLLCLIGKNWRKVAKGLCCLNYLSLICKASCYTYFEKCVVYFLYKLSISALILLKGCVFPGCG